MPTYTYFSLIRGFLTSALVLAVLLVLTYACFCNRVDQLSRLGDKERVLLVGRVRGAYGSGSPDGAYELEDVTGTTFVGTKLGVPQTGAFVVIWGTKTSTATGRPVVTEGGRAGSF